MRRQASSAGVSENGDEEGVWNRSIGGTRGAAPANCGEDVEVEARIDEDDGEAIALEVVTVDHVVW